MTDRFVTVPDSLEIPADVKVPSARLSDSTTAGRALLDAADAAAQRTALGLGTAATTPSTDYATAAQGAKADATTVEQVTLIANLAYALPAGTPAGVVHRVVFTQDGTGGHTVTYDGAPVTVDLAAGASTTVELHPVGAGHAIRYPVTNLDAQVSALVEDGGSTLGASLSSTLVPRATTAAQETAALAASIMSASGWVVGAGWAGDLATGFTHTPGSTDPLTWTPPVSLGADVWLVEWQWEGESTDQFVYAGYDVTLGGGSAGIIYQGAAPSNVSYSRAIKPTSDGDLVFSPWTAFAGRIHSITVRKVGTPAAIGVGWRNAVGNRTAELRFGANGCVYLGVDAGRVSVSTSRNVAIGAYAMARAVTAMFNVAVGYGALAENVNGTRNVGVGYYALAANVAGDRNVGIGPFALTRLTSGARNVAIGTDVLWRLQIGNDNIGLGYLTLTELGDYGDPASGNIAIGRYAMRQSKLGNDNVAIGVEALLNTQGSNGIAIGTRALRNNLSAESVAIGADALANVNATTAQPGQTSIGTRALRRGASATQFIYNTAVGYEAGENLLRSRNTAIGHQALKGDPDATITGADGSYNTAIGYQAGIAVTTGANNILIGSGAGSNLVTGSRNIIISGSADAASMNDRLNIGATLYGNLSTKSIRIAGWNPSARLHLPPGGAAASSAPLKFMSGPLLTVVEDGAIEYDGTDLYLTAGGTRYRLDKTAA